MPRPQRWSVIPYCDLYYSGFENRKRESWGNSSGTSVESEWPFRNRHGNNFAKELVCRVPPKGGRYMASGLGGGVGKASKSIIDFVIS